MQASPRKLSSRLVEVGAKVKRWRMWQEGGSVVLDTWSKSEYDNSERKADSDSGASARHVTFTTGGSAVTRVIFLLFHHESRRFGNDSSTNDLGSWQDNLCLAVIIPTVRLSWWIASWRGDVTLKYKSGGFCFKPETPVGYPQVICHLRLYHIYGTHFFITRTYLWRYLSRTIVADYDLELIIPKSAPKAEFEILFLLHLLIHICVHYSSTTPGVFKFLLSYVL